jgi:RNA polymerase sigma-70 factor (ECF subfamily)
LAAGRGVKMADKGFDEGIIIRIARKDRDAFAELYRMESDAVYGLALSILRNKEDAEDVMHDAFIRIFNAAGSYSPGGKPLAWIFTIVRNLCYNKIRDSEKTRDEEPAKFENEEQAGTTEGCGNDIEEATDRMVLDAAMECLEQGSDDNNKSFYFREYEYCLDCLKHPGSFLWLKLPHIEFLWQFYGNCC